MASEESETFVRAFARGLDVIQALGVSGPHQPIAAVAARTALPRSVVKRLVLTLLALGFARSDGKRFWLTPKVLTLGLAYLYTLPFWRQAQLVLEELRAQTGESCSLAVLDAEEIVYVIRIPSRRILSTNLTVGSRLPAHAVSLGRVLLAGLGAQELTRYLKSAALTQFTPRTVTAREALRRAVEAAHKKGYAWVDSEFDEAICGIAVPVRDGVGEVIAAININLVAGSFDERAAKARFLAPLRSAAAKIRTTTLG